MCKIEECNNEKILANNSFPHVDRINMGGELYNKKAMQNVIASKDWTFDNIKPSEIKIEYLDIN